MAVDGEAQLPDHPVITEVYFDPAGTNDGPVGRDPSSLHQEFIEIYLPDAASLEPGLNKDALRLTVYEVEGDNPGSSLGLINYRIDLPVFDLDPGNGTTGGAVSRPASGLVVVGWVDYVGDPPTDLAGTPATRIGLVNGGITSHSDYTFVAVNGGQFGGTENFPIPEAVSHVGLPGEAYSGILENGSGVYLLVDRDSPGYVELHDHDTVPPASADPDLPSGLVLMPTALLDAFAGNDDALFSLVDQPYDTPTGNDIDLETVLPLGGAFSLLAAQLPEQGANGYARLLGVAKTTESSLPDDPVEDALNAYQLVYNSGPVLPSPGQVSIDVTSAGAPAAELPTTYRLHPAVPSPFTSSTAIRFSLPEPGSVHLIIYDVAGRRVRTLLADSYEGAGTHEVLWRGRNERGAKVGTGVYFYKLVAGPHAEIRKLVLSR